MLNLTWRKSSLSRALHNCVEVAVVPGAVLIRDSQDPDGPVLTISPAVYRSMLTGARDER
jgi:hypothetical protein